MSNEQYVCLEHLRAMAQSANCCQRLEFLPAALTSPTPRRFGGPIGSYYRDRELRALYFQLSSLTPEQWEALRQMARTRV